MYSILDPARNPQPLITRVPIWIRYGLFGLVVLIASVIGGGVYWGLATLSSLLLFGWRILFYPAMAGGLCTGYISHTARRNLSIPANQVITLIILCSGVLIFIIRWWVEAKVAANGDILGYLRNQSHASGEIITLSDRARDNGSIESSPLLFWFLLAFEGLATVIATVSDWLPK